ncbi:Uncharacterised protein [Chlamydia trachomatis]|nr:Uncharacterised protein [Chlamydia trachomatis]
MNPFSSLTVGIPPPPPTITVAPELIAFFIWLIPTKLIGFGEATTFLNPRPASSTITLFGLATSASSLEAKNGPIGLVGFKKAGSLGSTKVCVKRYKTSFSSIPSSLNALVIAFTMW